MMPPNPGNFHFAGIDGRGRQNLLRSPGAGSPAVVRIEDPQSGSEGYTFDLEWREGFAPAPPPVVVERERSRRYTAEEAIRICKDSVVAQAHDRFRDADIEFRKVAIDDSPGRNDWVVGVLEKPYTAAARAMRFVSRARLISIPAECAQRKSSAIVFASVDVAHALLRAVSTLMSTPCPYDGEMRENHSQLSCVKSRR